MIELHLTSNKVLARVLLHVVMAAHPVHLLCDGGTLLQCLHQIVHSLTSPAHHTQHCHASHCAPVIRLR